MIHTNYHLSFFLTKHITILIFLGFPRVSQLYKSPKLELTQPSMSTLQHYIDPSGFDLNPLIKISCSNHGD